VLQVGFLFGLFFVPEDEGDTRIPLKRLFTFNGLHGLISQRQKKSSSYHSLVWICKMIVLGSNFVVI
jgi:hypothetical protein